MDYLENQLHEPALDQIWLIDAGDMDGEIQEWLKAVERSSGQATPQDATGDGASSSGASFEPFYDVTPEPEFWLQVNHDPVSFDQQPSDLGIGAQEPAIVSNRNLASSALPSTTFHHAMTLQMDAVGASKPSQVSPPVATAPRETFECTHPGCNRSFNRKEHRRRHQKDLHSGQTKSFWCEFCGNEFNRLENLRDHRKRHARRRTSNRIEYFEDAVGVIAHEERERISKAQRRRTEPKRRRSRARYQDKARGFPRTQTPQ